MSEHAAENDYIADALEVHNTLGARCTCGASLPPERLDTPRWFAEHLADVVRGVLGARIERKWGVMLRNGVYETRSERAALDLSGPRPDSGPAVTCLRTTYREHSTPWDVVTPPGVGDRP